MLVAGSMQVGEAIAKLNFAIVNRNGAEGACTTLANILWNIVVVDA